MRKTKTPIIPAADIKRLPDNAFALAGRVIMRTYHGPNGFSVKAALSGYDATSEMWSATAFDGAAYLTTKMMRLPVGTKPHEAARAAQGSLMRYSEYAAEVIGGMTFVED